MADTPDRTRDSRVKGETLKPGYVPQNRDGEREQSDAERSEDMLYRRAVEAAIWGMPIVSVDAMRRAFFRDAAAQYNDVVYLSKPSDWKFQITTPNASAHYVYINFNLTDGPVVYEVPAAVGVGLFGSMNDAWQAPMADVGPAGDDQGKGGKYLLLPPEYTEATPQGYFPVRFNTYNGYSLLRAIPTTSSNADVAKALDLVKKVRLYPLKESTNPPQSRHIDMAGKPFNAIAPFDARFYESLARMVKEETIQTRDLVAMGQLRSLGISKDAEFSPDAKTKDVLAKAIAEAHEGFMHDVTVGESVWPGSHWIMPGHGVGPKTGFTFETEDHLEVGERGMSFFFACAPPKKLGAASFYVWGVRDKSDELLDGSTSYHLRVPPKVPVKQFWAVTVYDLESAAFFCESPRVELNSYHEDMQKNSDGSVDVFFGPSAPAGKESNWVYTAPDKPWFAAFRFYGPEKAVSDKTWVLPDIERAS